MPKVYITKDFSFEAAHHLLGYDGPCSNIHGHSYKLSVTVSGNVNIPKSVEVAATDCMVMDFSELKRVVEKCIIHTHDHEDLNLLYFNPTAEVMVQCMFQVIRENLPKNVTLERVALWETSSSYAECRRGDV